MEQPRLQMQWSLPVSDHTLAPVAVLGPAAEAINRAALRVAKAGIETCVVGIGGSHVRGINSRGGISMGNRMRDHAGRGEGGGGPGAERGAASGSRGSASAAAGVHSG